jgi:hypothetical protein
MISKPLDYPPFYNVVNVLESCPLSIFMYIMIWKNRSGFQTIVNKDTIQEKYLTDQDNFRKHLFHLSDINIIFFTENENSFVITLDQPQIKAEGYTLC